MIIPHDKVKDFVAKLTATLPAQSADYPVKSDFSEEDLRSYDRRVTSFERNVLKTLLPPSYFIALAGVSNVPEIVEGSQNVHGVFCRWWSHRVRHCCRLQQYHYASILRERRGRLVSDEGRSGVERHQS